MDEVTQQNAALVEEAAASSESLDEQANNLDKLMNFFKIGDEPQQGFGIKTRAHYRNTEKPVRQVQRKEKPPVHGGTPSNKYEDDSEWEEF
jgi:methyl-accepting chemotaxis protein